MPTRKPSLWVFTLMCLPLLLFTGTVARATANQTYKKGEYALLSHGISPNKQWYLAAHGDGELGYDNFHVYLFAGKKQRRIGPLTEISEILDTAASAYEAVWAPDSQHVAILWRSDRHVRAMILYRIANGRAYRVTGPTPLDIVEKQRKVGAHDAFGSAGGGFTVKWQDNQRFLLGERRTVKAKGNSYAQKLGEFATSDPYDPPNTLVYFSGEAQAEIAEKDCYRIIGVKPGPKN